MSRCNLRGINIVVVVVVAAAAAACFTAFHLMNIKVPLQFNLAQSPDGIALDVDHKQRNTPKENRDN
jgi:hypothetical protein